MANSSRCFTIQRQRWYCQRNNCGRLPSPLPYFAGIDRRVMLNPSRFSCFGKVADRSHPTIETLNPARDNARTSFSTRGSGAIGFERRKTILLFNTKFPYLGFRKYFDSTVLRLVKVVRAPGDFSSEVRFQRAA